MRSQASLQDGLNSADMFSTQLRPGFKDIQSTLIHKNVSFPLIRRVLLHRSILKKVSSRWTRMC